MGASRSCFEIGHLQVMPEGPLCGCGSEDALKLSPAASLFCRGGGRRLFEASASLHDAVGTDLANIRSGALAASIKAGDKVIEQIVRNAAQWLGIAIANVINLISPDIVVLGGGLVEAMPELYCDEVRQVLRKRVMGPFRDTYKVAVSSSRRRSRQRRGCLGGSQCKAKRRLKWKRSRKWILRPPRNRPLRSAPLPGWSAVIDIGSTSIRMGIAEIDSSGSVRQLDSLQQAVSLGKDTFTKGLIDAPTIDECVGVLRSFREILQQYRIVDENQIRAVATSAVREATNRDAFLDRIYVATGFNVEVIDESETNRITYLAVSRLLDSELSLTRGDTLLVEVGGGNTEALLLSKGQVSYSHTYHLGSLRLREMLDDYGAPVVELPEIMQIHIDRAVQQIRQRLSVEGHTDLMALGGDIRFAAAHLIEEWDKKALIKLPLSALSKFTKEI